jgi:hypothetical protein
MLALRPSLLDYFVTFNDNRTGRAGCIGNFRELAGSSVKLNLYLVSSAEVNSKCIRKAFENGNAISHFFSQIIDDRSPVIPNSLFKL